MVCFTADIVHLCGMYRSVEGGGPVSKRTIGYIVYYVLFALFAIYGTVKHWPMQIFVAIIPLVEILLLFGRR